MKKLSLVVPCFNEEAAVAPFLAAVDALGLKNALEFVFVDDGSSDGTLATLKQFAANDERVRYVSFSRNFGKESALLAGLNHATGELVVTMDVDLQHDPKLLIEMVAAVENEGCDSAAVYRRERAGEGVLRAWFARRYYALMSRYSEVSLKDGSMDYRMMTREFVEAVKSLGESGRFTKGIYQWVGFKTKWIATETLPRTTGASRWNFEALFAYAINGIMSFSTAPLKIASVLGIGCCLLAFVYMAYALLKWLVFGVQLTGWPALVAMVLMLGGLQLFVVGILGLYVAGIFRETKHRPPYIIREQK